MKASGFEALQSAETKRRIHSTNYYEPSRIKSAGPQNVLARSSLLETPEHLKNHHADYQLIASAPMEFNLNVHLNRIFRLNFKYSKTFGRIERSLASYLFCDLCHSEAVFQMKTLSLREPFSAFNRINWIRWIQHRGSGRCAEQAFSSP